MTPNYDLNLLIVFHILLEEGSVTRTGQRLGRTQSAVSNSLKRLRELVGDPLFVRTPSGIGPTQRARELAPLAAKVYEASVQFASPSSEFDPATADAQFTVGAPDRFSLPIFLPLLERLGRISPQMVINLRTTDRDYATRLIDSGDIDMAMGWFDRIPPHVASTFVFEDRFVCLCRNDHPLRAAATEPTLDDILSHAHLVVSSTGDRTAAFDAVLRRNGLRRAIAATVMNFTIVPELLARTDLVGVFTHRTSEYFTSRYPLSMVPVPLEVAPIANQLIWHRRFEKNDAHAWLRRQILAASGPGMRGGGSRGRADGG